jgi:F-type H+-transporting ATPase subunit alpha
LSFNLDAEEIGVILLGESSEVRAGSEVRRTRQVADVPVGYELLGRVIDPLGSALDGKGAINTWQRRPIERPVPSIMDRVPVDTPLQTGIKAIDALIPIGRGQRELILGDRQTGKTTLITDTIINQKDQNVVCVYCAIGQEKSKIAKVIEELRRFGALSYCVIVSAPGDIGPGLKYIAPYAATSIAEHFMEQGRDVMIAYDDLTRHAQAYRELSLLLRRPPGREAYPGDIFYIHSRLLERATHLRAGLGGGSLTALPVIETHGQNLSAYIPTNLISITDGQVYLSPELFRKGVLPAIDIGRSVSRVGGKAQLPAYRRVAGDLSLSYSQFEELESFSRFGTRLDEDTRRTIDRGRRVREVLKQQPHHPMPVAEQIAVLFSVINGLFDDVPVDRVREIERAIADSFAQALPDLYMAVQNGEELDEEDYETMLEIFRRAMQSAREA